MSDGNDSVKDQQQQNPAHAGLTSFYLVNHENFEMLGGPFGKADKFKKSIEPRKGAIALSRDDFWPVGTEDLKHAKRMGTVAQYVAAHRVTNRFVYVLSVVKGQQPVFRYELYADAKGRIRHLSRDAFHSRHAADSSAGELPNDKYISGTTWKGGKQHFFQQTLPLFKHNESVAWHFFALPFHLTADAVKELEGDKELLSPDPGFGPRAPEKTQLEDLTVWSGADHVPVENGMLARVLDPVHIAESMHAELAAKSEDFIQYVMPVGTGKRAEMTERRTLIAGIAGCAKSVIERSNTVDLGNDTIRHASQTWPEVRDRCFTPHELSTLDHLSGAVSGRGHDSFLLMDERMREEYLRRQAKAATKTMLWLTSKPWAFVEREFKSQAWRKRTLGHLLLSAMAEALSQAAGTDIGRYYLNEMIEACEDKPDNTAVPNASTIQEFILRDKPQPAALDVAKTVIKAGKAPFDLWSKFVTLYGAKDKKFLRTLTDKHPFDAAVSKKLSGMAEQKRVFALTFLVMGKRLNRLYGFNVVEADITEIFAAAGKKAVVIYGKNPLGDGIDRTYSLQFETPDDLDLEIKKLRKNAGLVAPEPRGFRKLEFGHVSSVMGLVNLFFSARSLYISAVDKGTFDQTKSSFAFLRSLYSVPWLQKKAASRLEKISLSFLAKKANVWVAQRAVAMVAFAIQVIAVGFAADDFLTKWRDGTTEATIGSGINVLAEVAVGVAAALVIASGGVLTPAAATAVLLGVGLSVASFVYTQFIPTDQQRALEDCIFGKKFPSTATGRPWQACLGNNLRFLDPAKTKPAMDAYRNQISAFSNLMHNFNLKVSLGDDNKDTGVWVTIWPSAVPRTAYFDIKLRLRWWIKGKPHNDTWSEEFTLQYHPFPDNVPPLTKPQSDELQYNNQHRGGVVAPKGGPLLTYISKPGAHPIQLAVVPRTGDAEIWTGTITNIVGGTQKPVHVGLRYFEDYRVRAKKSADGKHLLVQLTFQPSTTEGIEVDDLSITVAFQRYIENQKFGSPEQQSFAPELEQHANGHQRQTIEFKVPIDDSDGYRRQVAGFRVGLVYEDTKLGERKIHAEQTEPFAPGVDGHVFGELTKKRSEGAYDIQMDYAARLVHTGDVAVVDFVGAEGTVINPSDKTKRRKDALVLDKVVLQYVRNPGAGNAAEEGTVKNPVWRQMLRVNPGIKGDKSFATRTFTASNGGPIELFDALAVRFTINVSDDDGKQVWTEGDYEPDLKAQWGWETREQHSNAAAGGRIRSATCEVTMVMDGDPSTHKFMPNSIVGATPSAVPLTATAEFFEIGRELGLGTESPEVAAIDVCRTS